MGLERGIRVPHDLRARQIMALDMVGVKLHEAGNEKIAALILAARGPAADLRDPSVAQDQMAVDHRVLENDAGVGENGFLQHVSLSERLARRDGSIEW